MLSNDQLKQVLIEQREFLLKKSIGIEREILTDIKKKINLPHIVVLTGIRRCGKSTILRQIINKFYDDKDFYYVNFEDERLFNFKAQDFNIIYETLIELFGEKKTFFLDEIQNIENFENFVRRFYDNGFKFFITGSNAKLLSKELGTKLTGRHVDIVVRPFSFKEFLKLKNFEFSENMIYKTKFRAELKNFFETFLFKGGMPEFLLFDDAELLINVYEDVVIKDIVVRYGVDNVYDLRELYQYLITNFSNKFSYNSIRNFISLSVNTIKKFISYLEETYFSKTIKKFDYSLKKQLKNEKKLYVLENGFIQYISTKLTKDKGWFLENLVFNCLDKFYDVYYFNDKFECDFVAVKNKKIDAVFQVCWELNDKNREREINGLIEAMVHFKLKKGYIITYDQDKEIKKDGKLIILKSIWKCLLKNKFT